MWMFLQKSERARMRSEAHVMAKLCNITQFVTLKMQKKLEAGLRSTKL